MSVRGQATGRSTARRPAILLALALVATLVPLVALSPIEPAGALPAGFSEQTVLSGFNEPMAVEFSDDGRVFVAEKSGIIKVFDGLGDTTATVFADLRTKVYNGDDRGLMSIALHPDFPAEPWVYVLYAHDAAIGGTAPRWGSPGGTDDPCPNPPGETGDGCVISGRLSRLERGRRDRWARAGARGGLVPAVPEPLRRRPRLRARRLPLRQRRRRRQLQLRRLRPGRHPAQPLRRSARLASGGVQTVPTAEGGALRSPGRPDARRSHEPRRLGHPHRSRDRRRRAGQPRHHQHRRQHAPRRRRRPAQPLPHVVPPGHRRAVGRRRRLDDVGGDQPHQQPDRPTIDNFGWPCKENTAPTATTSASPSASASSTASCRPRTRTTPTGTAQAIISGDGCPTNSGSSTSGVAFYEGGNYPAEYDGALFFADYSRRCIWVMFPGADGVPDPSTRTLFRQSSAFPVELEIGPNGDLYYVDIAAGALRRIRYTHGQPASHRSHHGHARARDRCR